MKPLILLAQLEAVFGEKPSKSYSRGLRDILIVVGVALLISALLFFWAAVWRKRRRSHSSHHHHGDVQPGGDPSIGKHKRHRRRRRKASHPDKRPRNPTLAETGGLPPPRADEAVPNIDFPNANQPSHNPQERL